MSAEAACQRKTGENRAMIKCKMQNRKVRMAHNVAHDKRTMGHQLSRRSAAISVDETIRD